jgi:membrane fusion protein (multidrug efflux system)
VRVSQAIGDQWLVEDGLVAGDRVIVEGLQKIQPGAPVQPTEAGATPAASAPAAPAAAPAAAK